MGSVNSKLVAVVVREVAAALSVLSLVLLALAHQPIYSGGYDIYRLADGSLPVICGQSLGDDGDRPLSSGCDACRISAGIVVPTVPCLVRKTLYAGPKVFLVQPIVVPPVQWLDHLPLARAPPVLV